MHILIHQSFNIMHPKTEKNVLLFLAWIHTYIWRHTAAKPTLGHRLSCFWQSFLSHFHTILSFFILLFYLYFYLFYIYFYCFIYLFIFHFVPFFSFLHHEIKLLYHKINMQPNVKKHSLCNVIFLFFTMKPNHFT